MPVRLSLFVLAVIAGIPGASLTARQNDLNTFDPALLQAMRFRSIGPHRGGRVTAVEGVAGRPFLFYMGTTGGGVWRSTTGGQTWHNVSDAFFAVGSIGAIDAADSDPDVTPYIHQIHVERIEVLQPREAKEITRLLVRVRDRAVGDLERLGIIPASRFISTRTLLDAGNRLELAIKEAQHTGKPAGHLFGARSTQALALKVTHAIELAQTQGAASLVRYFHRTLFGP